DLTVRATVTTADGPVDAGVVVFREGGQAVAGCEAVELDASGVAPCPYGTPSAGLHTLEAEYVPAAGAPTAGSKGERSFRVGKAATSASLEADPATSATYGDLVTLKATITVTTVGGAVPTGTVRFTDGGTTIGT